MKNTMILGLVGVCVATLALAACGDSDGTTEETAGDTTGDETMTTSPSTTAGGSMTEVEVVGPETGATRVEYRRDGQPIGAEDPEAQMSVPLDAGGS